MPAFALLVAADRAEVKARFLRIEKQAHDRLLYTIGNTPVTRQDPYYSMTLATSQGAYEVEYDLRSQDEELPAGFVEGGEAVMRLEGRHLFLRAPGGREINTLIVKRNRWKKEKP
jgi:hypothetical protein